jgi:excisionase family DNA binding protein
VSADAHAHAQTSRASAPIGSHLRDARARTTPTQRDQTEGAATRPTTIARGDALQAYTVEQVAEILHVSRDKVYQLLRTRQLHSIKIGNSRRITNKHLAEFVASLENRS